MKILSFFFVSLFSINCLADWNQDFELLKNRPRSYEDTGSICEEIARLHFERQFNSNDYQIEVGIAYGDQKRTLGELDVIVFDRKSQLATHIIKVKCWKDKLAGLEKAMDQRKRFLKNVHQNQIEFESTSTHQKFSADLFQNVTDFTSIGQKGCKEVGYDQELEYDLKELHNMRMDMLRCQDSGNCVKP